MFLSQSLNEFLDCGASLSRPVKYDLCPTNRDTRFLAEAKVAKKSRTSLETARRFSSS